LLRRFFSDPAKGKVLGAVWQDVPNDEPITFAIVHDRITRAHLLAHHIATTLYLIGLRVLCDCAAQFRRTDDELTCAAFDAAANLRSQLLAEWVM
jgi:hypothetical protein